MNTNDHQNHSSAQSSTPQRTMRSHEEVMFDLALLRQEIEALRRRQLAFDIERRAAGMPGNGDSHLKSSSAREISGAPVVASFWPEVEFWRRYGESPDTGIHYPHTRVVVNSDF